MSLSNNIRLFLFLLYLGVATGYGYGYAIDFVNAYGFEAFLFFGEVLVSLKAVTWPVWEIMALVQG